MARKRNRPAGQAGSSVDAYVSNLGTGAGAGEAGSFTLERSRARELLEKLALAQPSDWVLLVVQAAVLRGATGTDATVTEDRVTLAFDGAACSRDDLERLYDPAGGTALEEAGAALSRARLGLALGAVRALDWREIALDSGDSRITCRPGAEEVIDAAPEPVLGTRLDVLRTTVAGVEPGEARALRTRCRFLEIPLVMNGTPVASSPAFPVGTRVFPVDVPGARGQAGFVPQPDDASWLSLVQHGVIIEEVQLRRGVRYFRAVVHAPGLRTDLTGLAPVRDGTHQALLQAVLEVHLRAGKEVRLESLERAALEAEARHLLDEVTARYHSHQRFWDIMVYLGTLAVLQSLAIPIARDLAGSAALWPWLLPIEAVALIAAGFILVKQRPSMEPDDGDSVDALVQARLEGRPELPRAVKDRISETPGTPLEFYFQSRSEQGKRR